MVGISEIRQWKAETLEAARSKYKKILDMLTSEGDDFAKLKLTDAEWSGEAASHAMQDHTKLVREGDRHAAGVGAIVKGLEQAADAIPPLHRQINEAEELGRKYGFQVGDNGEVTDQFEGQDPPKDMHPEDRARAKKQIQIKLEQVVRTGMQIDRDLANVYSKAGADEYGRGQTGDLSTAAAAGAKEENLGRPFPPKHGSPAQNAAWWASLSKQERNTLIEQDPDKIGNLNGLPAKARSKANMHRLPKMRAKLKRKLDQLKNELQKIPGGPGLNHGPYESKFRQLNGKINEVDAKIKSLDKVSDTMKQGNRTLLTLDGSNKRMEAAVGIGDVDGADNVSVFTPGFTTTVDGSLEGYDRNMANLVQKENSINQSAGDDRTNAAVTWIGYQAPQTDEVLDSQQSVAGDAAAKRGGENLAGFLNGVGAAHHGPMHMTALGHSYGSTATGEGLGHKTPVNDAVLFGSPGEGWNKPHVNGGHIYSEEAAGDYVPGAGHTSKLIDAPGKPSGPLGPDTYSDPNIEHLSSSFGQKPDSSGVSHPSIGHSEYLKDNSTSQYNMAAVGSDHQDFVQQETPEEVKMRQGSYAFPWLMFGTPS